MKRAIVDKIMIGGLVIFSIIVFMGTSTDETRAKMKIEEIRQLTVNVANSMAGAYMQPLRQSRAEAIGSGILSNTSLGREVLEKELISFTWSDRNNNSIFDSVTVTINGYEEDVFWYKFLGLEQFDIATISHTTNIDENPQFAYELRFGGGNAANLNMIGTYQMDDNGNVINARILMDDRVSFNAGDFLGNIIMPDTKMFIISDGYKAFLNKDLINKEVVVFKEDGVIKFKIDNRIINKQIYFQDKSLNNDNYAHMQIIPKSVHSQYVNHVNLEGNSYDTWIDHAKKNDINYQTDPSHEYIFAMEDLENGGDQDFNDIFLDTTQTLVFSPSHEENDHAEHDEHH